MSWFRGAPDSTVSRLLVSVTEPLLQPIRRMVPRFGGIDLSPMIAIIALTILTSLLGQAA